MEFGPNFPNLLIVEDEESTRLALKDLIGRRRLRTHTAKNSDEALVLLKKHRFEIMLTDIEMRHSNEGVELIPRAKALQEDLEIVVFSSYTDFERVKEAMRLGATDYVPKTSGMNELALAIERSLARRASKRKVRQLETEIAANHKQVRWIGSSEASKNILRTIKRLRSSDLPILITGETGTGKEVVARLLRQERADGLEPFVSVDASTIQSSIAESLLFGFEKGAFTGADQGKFGLFEAAHGGSIYFDEMGNMPLEIQMKLLRVLQEKEILRLGASLPIPLKFRVISATNQNLETLCQEGRFKDDLLQRIAVFTIEVPSLRERVEDIPDLLNHFSSLLSTGGRTLVFSPAAIAAFQEYPFPGNVRELHNMVAVLYSLCDSDIVDVSDLPLKVQKCFSGYEPNKGNISSDTDGSTKRALESYYDRVGAFEYALLKGEYELAKGNVTRMAARLKMDRSHLHNKLKELCIHSVNIPSAGSAARH